MISKGASSGLPVVFVSNDPNVASIDGNRAIFHLAGLVLIYAAQSGNEAFYEAPSVFNRLLIRDWDPNKKMQTITFELQNRWQLSTDNQQLKLSASASSGLPVIYIANGANIGRFLNNTTFYIYHAGEGGNDFREKYEATITIIVSQEGNDEYNPADNIARELHVIGDVVH